MRIESYSPSVEVYAAVSGENGSVTYYNLSDDVERVSVSMRENAVAECTIKIQNKNGKYMNVFLPMDRVTVFATKRDRRQQLFTGYISSMPRYQMYTNSFEMKCYCMLYRLQRLYWDPDLLTSGWALGYANAQGSWEAVLLNLLIDVADVPASNILIGSMPDSVIEWARALYAAKQTEYDDMRSKVEEFYAMMASTNGAITASTASTANAVATGVKEPLAAGQTLAIPSYVNQTGIIGDATEYERDWAVDSSARPVYELWLSNGSRFDSAKHIAMIGRYYLVAVRPQFGSDGDYLDIKLHDGTVIHAIKADTKGSDAAEWGHDYGGGKISVVEWEVDREFLNNRNVYLGDWLGQTVVSITNKGSCL